MNLTENHGTKLFSMSCLRTIDYVIPASSVICYTYRLILFNSLIWAKPPFFVERFLGVRIREVLMCLYCVHICIHTYICIFIYFVSTESNFIPVSIKQIPVCLPASLHFKDY